MKLWIIGKRGMLSRAMQRICEKEGIDYIATTRKEVDLEDDVGIKAQFETLNFTHVINCAAYTAVDQAEEDQNRAYALNADAVGLLAKLCHAHSKKLIHFSTDYVFNGEKGKYEEGDETSPLSVYGKSKAEGEKRLMEFNPKACLIRTSWLFGREGNHFVKTMVRFMQEKETLNIVCDQKGRPTYADDLARATLSLLDESGTFHFANDGETTWHGFAKAIKKKLEEKKCNVRCQRIDPMSTEAFGAKAKRPASSILLTKKFTPPHWEAGLDEVISYALESE